MNIFFHSRIIIITLTFFILLVTLYFGVRFKGFRFENHAARLQNEPGIHFKRFGIAYAKIKNLDNPVSLKNFTIEIVLGAEKTRTHGFDLIMTVHDGKDADQLIIGQWQSHVIIMNGDDYSHTRGIKRISADIFNKPNKKMFVTVTTGEKGTELFVNGESVQNRTDLILRMPDDGEPVLTLGNSVHGNSSWSGNIYGFALYGHQLSHEKIKNRYKIWAEDDKYISPGEENSLLFFNFDENTLKNTSDIDESSSLNVPVYFPVLKKRILLAPWKGVSLDENSIRDIVINLFGFIPMGFILFLLFLNLFSVSQRRIMFFSVLLCFLISLCIEITQAWIPSRSSQSLDLILNTAGGLVGSYTAKRLSRKSQNQ